MSESRPGGRPMSAISTAPTVSAPGKRYRPAFGLPRVTVTSAPAQAGSTVPVSASTPEGRSTASRRRDGRRALSSDTSRSRLSRGPAMGRERPVPSTASTTMSADARAARSSGVPGARIGVRCASTGASLGSPSGRSPTRHTATCPPHELSLRATTSPSPPLLPLPTKTRVWVPTTRPRTRLTARATSRPAFSISVSVLVPARSDLSSRVRIWSEVTIFIGWSPGSRPIPLGSRLRGDNDPGSCGRNSSMGPPVTRRRPSRMRLCHWRGLGAGQCRGYRRRGPGRRRQRRWRGCRRAGRTAWPGRSRRG